MLRRLDDILEILKGKEKVILSVAAAEAKEVLLSIKDAVKKDIIEPILVGDKSKIN